MKKLIVSVLFALYATSWGWCDNEIITREINIASFDKIIINQGYIRFHQSNERRVVVSVDSDKERYVIIEVKNNVLTLGIRPPSGRGVSFNVFIIDVYGHVTDVSIQGAGTFECMEKITVPSFNADIGGHGTLKMDIKCDDISITIGGGIGVIEGHIECNNFITNITGGGFININGMCKNAYISCNTPGGYGTFGTLDCINFITDDIMINIDGSVEVNIKVIKSLNANIINDSKINYYGDPKLNVNGNQNNIRKME